MKPGDRYGKCFRINAGCQSLKLPECPSPLIGQLRIFNQVVTVTSGNIVINSPVVTRWIFTEQLIITGRNEAQNLHPLMVVFNDIQLVANISCNDINILHQSWNILEDLMVDPL